jgi:glycosyltransferase involved in cell wall biosynthesis/ribosomal protein S18 acetylase RimI-like enzyme
MSAAAPTRPRVLHLTTVEMSLRYLLFDQLRAIRDAGFDVTAMSAPGPWAPCLEEEGIRHIPWHHAARSWGPAQDLRALRELYAVLRRERFDVVHTHTPKPGVLGRLAARAVGVPCVANTVHGYYATPEDRWLKRTAVLGVERLAARCSDLELFQSGEDLEWALSTGTVAPAKAVRLGNGVDLDRFDRARVTADELASLRAELGLSEGEFVVTTVGRLVAHKGCREFFQAAKAIRAVRPDVRFVAIGGSDTGKEGAVDEREQAAAADDVVFAGWREDVAAVLALTDVFALPSWGPEGMPRAAMEASAMGVPMVLTDIRGCREVGRNGKEALLVPPRDSDALAAAIETLLDRPALRTQLGAAASERARERFDQRHVFARILGEYERVLRRRGVVAAEAVGPFSLRRARADDASALARMHRERMPEGFLSTLGQPFLTRVYRALIAHKSSAAFVAEEHGHVVGFATGVASPRAFARRFLIRHGVPAGILAAPVLARPAALRKLAETAAHADRGAPRREAEIVSVAVEDGHDGAGIGGRLVRLAVSELAALGATTVKVVASARNERATSLYRTTGFEPREEIALHDGAPSVVWVRPCHS